MNWYNDTALLILLQSGLARLIYCAMILALITQENEMKISNSKKQLAKIIHENGGWRDGMSFSWYGNKTKKGYFGELRPRFDRVSGAMVACGDLGVNAVSFECTKLPNWHQTILSRDEYFHLYPAPDAKPEFCESVMRSIPEPSDKPTIEQLAADYRNAKDCADRKQQESDDAKADADAKLAELVAAGKAIGLVVGVDVVEPELIITDWRDLKVGDIIEYVDGDIKDKIGMTGPVVEFAPDATDGMYVRLKCDNWPNKGRLGWPRKFRFIRRP